MADQNQQFNLNKMNFMSPEERARLEKTKLVIRQHFLKFFRHHAVKKNKKFFDKWLSYREFQWGREQEFNAIRKGLLVKRHFKSKLRNEKDKQQSHVLLNGFKSLNQNNLKNDEEVDQWAESQTVNVNETMAAKLNEE